MRTPFQERCEDYTQPKLAPQRPPRANVGKT
jgi:hypothetical protein